MENVKANETQNETQSSSHSNLLIKKCSIFDTKQSKILLDDIKEVLEGFHQDFDSSFNQETNLDAKKKKDNRKEKIDEADGVKSLSLTDKISCTTCNCSFNDRDEQVDHYRGDLHLFNLKQKLKGKAVVSIDEFEKLSDISSISGSDSENEMESSSSSSSDEDSDANVPHYAQVARNKPKISFKLNDETVLVMFRCILHGKKDLPDNQQELLDKVKSIKSTEKWAIILVAAGHFAAAVFKGDQVVVHKTFHRYVVRAKRGTVQSQHDSSGKYAKSAGANIRRSQEAAFKDDIRLLIGTEWKSDLDECKCIFIRIPPYNRSVLISAPTSQGQNLAPFSKDDHRLRHIPFMTFRPTFNEIKRTHTLLSKMEHYNEAYTELTTKLQKKINESSSAAASSAQNKPSKKAKSKSKSKSNKNEEVQDTKPKEELVCAKEAKAENLVEEEEEDKEDLDEEHEVQGPEVTANEDDFIQKLDSSTLKLFNEIYTACFTNNAAKLEQILNNFKSQPNTESNNQISLEKLLNKRLNNVNGFTLLHLVGQKGNTECIWQLLLNGANPALPDLTKQRRLPYFVASNKQTKDQYRRFLNDFPDRFDYSAAKIASPLSVDKLNEKLEKEKERKRNQRKLKKQREALTKNKEKEIEVELAERKRFLELSDAEKRKLLVDRNFLNILPVSQKEENQAKTSSAPTPNKLKKISRCWFCGLDMSTSEPFEYFDYKFCSTKCLKSHRTQNEQQKLAQLKK